MEKTARKIRNKLKILLTEDEPIVRKVHMLMLKNLDYQVDIAENGKKALQLFDQKNFDLIFLDIRLPDTTGIKIAEKIRRRKDDKKHIPIIAATACITDTLEDSCRQAGIERLVAKPISLFNLGLIIREVLNERKAKRSKIQA